MTEGTWSWGGGTDDDARLASDPGASGADLARIVENRPDLRPAVAANPAAYPALVEWLRALRDPAVDAALAARDRAASSYVPSSYQPPTPSPYQPPTYAPPTTAGPAATYAQPAQPGYAPQAEPAYSAAPGYAAQAEPPAAAAWPGYSDPLATGNVPVFVEPPRPRRRTGLWIGIGLGAVAVIGAGAAGFALVGGKLGGSPTPEAAATKLIESVAEKDWLSLAGSLSPAEFTPFRQTFDDLSGTARPTPDAEAQEAARAALDALEITVEDLEVEEDELDEGLTKVTVVDGTLTIDGDPDVLADGLTALVQAGGGEQALMGMGTDDFRDELADELARQLPLDVDLAGDLAVDGDGPFVVTVQEGGKWYVSPLMTLGEYIAQSSGIRRGDMPDPADLVKPASPVAAAEQFVDALTDVPDGDLGPLAAVLPLAERRFVAVYGQAFVDEAVASSGPSGTVLRVTASDFEVADQQGSRAAVVPTDLGIEVTDDWGVTSLRFDGDCLDVEDSYGRQRNCMSDLPLLATLGLGELRVTTVQEGGGWYVSVLGTLGDWSQTASENLVRLLDEGKLEDQDWWAGQLPGDVACYQLGIC